MRAVVPRDCSLSARQLEVIQGLADGLKYGEIAFKLGLSSSTVRSHLNNAYRELGVTDRAQCVVEATRRGWIANMGDPDARVLQRIELAVTELCTVILRRTRLTAHQKELLSAFDAVLYAREDDEYVVARRNMSIAVKVVCDDAGIILGERKRRDLVDLLTDYIVGQRHTNIKRGRVHLEARLAA